MKLPLSIMKTNRLYRFDLVTFFTLLTALSAFNLQLSTAFAQGTNNIGSNNKT
jgi:hypothetical protein